MESTVTSLQCTKCKRPIENQKSGVNEKISCQGCGSILRAFAFPALYHVDTYVNAEKVDSQEDASCFIHDDKKAVYNCCQCGRFVCMICDIHIGENHFCPECVASAKKSDNDKKLKNSTTLYDSVALGISVLQFFFGPLSILCSAIVLFMVVKYWNKVNTVVPRSKWRFILAVMIVPFGIWFGATFFIGFTDAFAPLFDAGSNNGY